MRIVLDRLKSVRLAPLSASLAVALVATGLAASGRSTSGTAEEPKLPADLAHVPSDSAAFLSVRVADLWESTAAKPVRARIVEEAGEAIKAIEKSVGVSPSGMDRVTFFFRAIAPGADPTIVIATVSPIDRKQILATLGPRRKEEKRGGKTLFSDAQSRRAVYLIDDHSFAVGFLGDLESLVDRSEVAGAGPLTPGLRMANAKHSAVAGADVAKLKEFIGSSGEPIPPQVAPFIPLLEGRAAFLTFDVAEPLRAEMRMSFASEAAANAGMKPLKAALALAQVAVPAELAAIRELRDRAAEAELLKGLAVGLASATIASEGNDLTAKLEVRANVEVLGGGIIEALRKSQQAARRTQSTNNLKQIALAMHNYHSVASSFPPAAVLGTDGKPLLSWRVLLLPYMEQQPLYNEFHLDEPWDSDHNKKLLSRMPPVFRSDAAGTGVGQTYLQGFQGEHALFDGKKGIRITDITDGTSNTFMVVEASRGVPWTKPEDIPYDPAKPLPKLGFREDGFLAAYCDGSVRFIPRATAATTIRALITRNGGETIP
jgi:hypothetical protein